MAESSVVGTASVRIVADTRDFIKTLNSGTLRSVEQFSNQILSTFKATEKGVSQSGQAMSNRFAGFDRYFATWATNIKDQEKILSTAASSQLSAAKAELAAEQQVLATRQAILNLRREEARVQQGRPVDPAALQSANIGARQAALAQASSAGASAEAAALAGGGKLGNAERLAVQRVELEKLGRQYPELAASIGTYTVALAEAEKMQSALDVTTSRARKTLQEHGATLSSVGKGMSGIAAAGVFGLYELAKSFAKTDFEMRKLDNSIMDSANVSKSQRQGFIDLSNTIQGYSKVSNEAVLSTEAFLVEFGLTADKVKTLTPLIVDLSAKIPGLSLSAATKMVARAVDGQTGTLRRAGVNVDLVAAKTNAYAATVEALTRVSGGFARVQGETLPGILARTKNLFQDLTSEVGGGVTPSLKIAASGFESLVLKLKDVDPSIKTAFGSLLVGGTAITGAIGGISLITGQLIKMKSVLLADPAQGLAGGLSAAGKVAGIASVAIVGFSVVTALLAQSQKEAKARVDALTQSMQAEGTTADEASTRQLSAYVLKHKELAVYLAKVGVSQEEVAASVAGTGQEYDALKAKLNAYQTVARTGRTGNLEVAHLIVEMDATRIALGGVTEAQKLATGAAIIAGRTDKQRAQDQKDAEQSAKDYNETLKEQIKVYGDLIAAQAASGDAILADKQATLSIEEAKTKLADATSGVGDAEYALTGIESAAGRSAKSLAQTERDAAKAAKEHAQAIKEQEAALHSLVDAQLIAAGGELGYEQAKLSTVDAIDALAEKQQELADIMSGKTTFGSKSRKKNPGGAFGLDPIKDDNNSEAAGEKKEDAIARLTREIAHQRLTVQQTGLQQVSSAAQLAEEQSKAMTGAGLDAASAADVQIGEIQRLIGAYPQLERSLQPVIAALSDKNRLEAIAATLAKQTTDNTKTEAEKTEILADAKRNQAKAELELEAQIRAKIKSIVDNAQAASKANTGHELSNDDVISVRRKAMEKLKADTPEFTSTVNAMLAELGNVDVVNAAKGAADVTKDMADNYKSALDQAKKFDFKNVEANEKLARAVEAVKKQIDGEADSADGVNAKVFAQVGLTRTATEVAEAHRKKWAEVAGQFTLLNDLLDGYAQKLAALPDLPAGVIEELKNSSIAAGGEAHGAAPSIRAVPQSLDPNDLRNKAPKFALGGGNTAPRGEPFVAILHGGEHVLTAEEVDEWQRNKQRSNKYEAIPSSTSTPATAAPVRTGPAMHIEHYHAGTNLDVERVARLTAFHLAGAI